MGKQNGVVTYVVTLNVVEIVTIGQEFGYRALAASCRPSDDENVVAAGNGHVGGFDRVQRW